jgi:hypothetical protein
MSLRKEALKSVLDKIELRHEDITMLLQHTLMDTGQKQFLLRSFYKKKCNFINFDTYL